MSTGNIKISPLTVRQWLEASRLAYPFPRDTEEYAGFSHVPVMPTLWGWLQAQRPWPSVGECVDRLMELADPAAIEGRFKGRIINRAIKLVYVFGRELHCYALLCERFDTVQWHHMDDLNQDIDFTVTVQGVPCGIRVFIEAPTGLGTDWRSVKEERRARRGAAAPTIPCFDLTNERQPDQLRNGLWLFRAAHVDIVKKKMVEAGIYPDGLFQA